MKELIEKYGFMLDGWTENEMFIVREHSLHTAFSMFCYRFGCHLMDFEKITILDLSEEK